MYWAYRYPRRAMMLELSSDGSPMALWLDGHPCGLGEAGDPEPKCNPANENTVSGKRLRESALT
jgi:hypothetical protein